ncbi:fused permease component [Vibrio ishigakensis]|uniref:Fused permease component n=1 Tax=Vibrio ishigakensis TaxID=1481914 RepID=A0A0B8P3V0_9VIBR|nr:fused permease component [Vibrio ishigakensis]
MVIDTAIVGMVLTGVGYIIVNFETIMNDLPFAEQVDVWIACSALVGLLELSRRCASPVFPILVGLALAYAYLGEYISGVMGHRGFDIFYLTEVIYLSDRGMWGMLVNIASTTLASFILFGSFLLHTGAGQTFLDMSSRISGSSVGGAAKIATIASGLFGSISGSSVANVATTGNFTIPLMKRLRYPSPFAGAVEAMASTGGQLAPPIMGTAAFVMAELVGVNYWTIITVASFRLSCSTLASSTRFTLSRRSLTLARSLKMSFQTGANHWFGTVSPLSYVPSAVSLWVLSTATLST